MFGDKYRFICSDYERDNQCVHVNDIVDLYNKEVEETGEIGNIDAIVNLAAISGIKQCESNPEGAVMNNVDLPIAIHEFCKEYPDVTKNTTVVFASSQAAKIPMGFYAQTKAMGEYWVSKLDGGASRDGAYGVSLRFANVYGGLNYFEMKSSVVAQFTKTLLEGKPPVIHGDGYQIRDFVHVVDVCCAIDKAINEIDSIKLYHDTEKNKTIFDIGSGIATPIIHLARAMSRFYRNGKEQVILDFNSDPGVSGNTANPALFSAVTGWRRNYGNIITDESFKDFE